MAASTAPVPAEPARPPGRTRKPDAWTTLFLSLTGTLGIWSIVLIGLTLLRIVDPTYDADDDTFDVKGVGAATVALIAVGQAFTMGAAMGLVPRLGLRMGTLMRSHRRVGRIGLLLAGAVAFLCWRAGGGAPTPDGIVHGALASTGFLAIATKFALLKWRPGLAFRVAPWLGVYAAAAFILTAIGTLVLDGLFELDDDVFGGGEHADDNRQDADDD